MATVNVHTGIFTSPKFTPLSDGAFRLWFHGLMWSKEHLTDGFIPSGSLVSLHRHALRLAPELLKVHVPGKGPLWHLEADGYRIHDFADWQDVSAVVQTRRRKWRDLKRGSKATAKPLSTVESTPDSTPESIVESQEGVGGGGGGGGGVGVGGGTDDTDTTAAPAARLVSSSPTANGTGPTHLACLELVEVWNRIRTAPAVDYAELQPASKRQIRVALQAKCLDAWERIFRRISASDYLAGRGEVPAVGLFKAIELGDRIDAGQYDNRVTKPAPVEARPDYTPTKFRHLKGAV